MLENNKLRALQARGYVFVVFVVLELFVGTVGEIRGLG